MAEEVVPGELDITDELIAERRAEEPGQSPDDMTPWQRPIVEFIDVLNLWAGRLTCLLLVPLIFVMVFEVVSRTLFGTLHRLGHERAGHCLGPRSDAVVLRHLAHAGRCYFHDWRRAMR